VSSSANRFANRAAREAARAAGGGRPEGQRPTIFSEVIVTFRHRNVDGEREVFAHRRATFSLTGEVLVIMPESSEESSVAYNFAEVFKVEAVPALVASLSS